MGEDFLEQFLERDQRTAVAVHIQPATLLRCANLKVTVMAGACSNIGHRAISLAATEHVEAVISAPVKTIGS